MTRLALVLLALVVGACGSPRPLGLEERPADRVRTPVSSVHYRDYDSAAELASALRWTASAPVLVSAHRGGPQRALPENAVETFEYALNHAPALIETDVRRTADGVLVLMHDETLDRTTTGTGRVDQTTFAQIRRLRLVTEDSLLTTFRVPTLLEALAWADGRAVLLLDVKPDVPYEELVASIRQHDAADRVAVITYSLEDHERLFAIAPDLVVSATAETPAEVDALLASPVDLGRVIAWTGVGVPNPTVVDRLHAVGIRAQAGAFGAIDAAARAASSPEPYDAILATGADVLSTDQVPLAALAAREANLIQ
ncbi:glycerophosphodiester phosphodiesterase family protein [Rubrivirga marina]|uniref:GP-PDE domain-containing protein n=1 Tax=Rubrivirga marina TaxID=1196024 RepID=A0A271IYX4_9BACT|nr:glycerophosphodiester phosphodiesterase family protein [Rubrivirga marina]PAP76168.1 hypothetical protein BSZ37_06760 [Rubrivirga marina]